MRNEDDEITLIKGSMYAQFRWLKHQKTSHLKLHHIIELANETGYPDQWSAGCSFHALMEQLKK